MSHFQKTRRLGAHHPLSRNRQDAMSSGLTDRCRGSDQPVEGRRFP